MTQKLLPSILFISTIALINSVSLTTFAEKNNVNILAVYNTSKLQIEYTGYSNSFLGTETKNYSDMGYGVLFEMPVGPKWNMESGIIYLPRGFVSQVQNFMSQPESLTYKWMSFYIPIEGRFHPTKLFTGFIGAYAALGTGNINISSDINPLSNTSKTYQSAGLKQNDLGMTYGAGLNIDLASNTELLIEIRWNEGLTNLVDSSQITVGNTTKITAHEFSLNLGIRM